MTKIKVQYLLIFEVNSLCSDIKSVKSLLQINSDISISGSILSYMGESFELELIKRLEDTENRYYQIDFTGTQDNIEILSDLLREVRKLTQNNKGQIEILVDEISFFYSQKAYPLIHKIENLMRKLITLFLIDSIGASKAKAAIPIQLKQDTSNNFLNQTDFIHLGEILTKEYSNGKVTELFKILKVSSSISELDLVRLKSFVPTSNLDRYFKDYIDFDSNYLTKKWKRLYELRCLVAHNNFFKKTEYDELVKLIEEVKLKLKNVINQIDEISIPEEEKESILEFAVSNSNQLIGEFIFVWKILEQKLHDFSNLDNRRWGAGRYIKIVTGTGFFSKEICGKIMTINRFRNELVHLTDISASNEEILRHIETTKRLNKQLLLKQEFGDSWAFTIDKGVLENIRGAVILRYENTEYGLNGVASSMGYEDVNEIWLDNPNIEGTKISIGTFITMGNNL
jgi:hypothetical protein